jgi:hypothetical protein
MQMAKFHKEAELLRRISELVGKLAIGSATPEDRDELVELYEQRAALMRPGISEKFDEMRQRKAG